MVYAIMCAHLRICKFRLKGNIKRIRHANQMAIKELVLTFELRQDFRC